MIKTKKDKIMKNLKVIDWEMEQVKRLKKLLNEIRDCQYKIEGDIRLVVKLASDGGKVLSQGQIEQIGKFRSNLDALEMQERFVESDLSQMEKQISEYLTRG